MTIEYLEQELVEAGWVVEQQDEIIGGKIVKNIIASRGIHKESSELEWIILGTHYDTRMLADRDPDQKRRDQPVPGANDGASGVAVLLELARTLPDDMDKNVWLVFFDAEDNGRIQDWDWALGSRAFVDSLNSAPDSVVIIDMVGDEDLDIYIEKNSDIDLVNSIWSTAESLGYSQYFIPFPKRSILDDHTPFLEEQIPAVLIIDLDYDFWHTTQDTIDKLSANSLQIVGDVVYNWLTSPD
jgi:Zn-dependent M28 family amino/carboxypeptidase